MRSTPDENRSSSSLEISDNRNESSGPENRNADQLNSLMGNLPEKDQDALAEMALRQIKKRARLEKIASGSIGNKLGIFFAIFGTVVILGFDGKLADYLPVVIVFLLILIQSGFSTMHSRIDAMYELMRLEGRMGNLQKTDKDELNHRDQSNGYNVSD